MEETVEPVFSPSFEQVSEKTWIALRCCATNPELMDRLLEAMKSAGRFEQWIAAPAITAALGDEPLAEGLDAIDRDDLASLLAAMINARFELYVSQLFGD